MTFSHLALSNIRGSWLRYAAFFLSSTFSVLLFFMYAQFLFHPDLAQGYLYGGNTTRMVLQVCMVLVAVFAFFFVLYSSGAFLRARNQEFGLLTLMGTTRRQLRRIIWLENTFLSLGAIAAGIGLGLLLSKLFLLAIARVLALPEPIPFAFVPRAMALTAGGFFVLYQFVTLVSAARVGRRSVIELLRAARQPRLMPRASVVLAVLGLVMVAGGYFGAASADGAAVVLAFLPTVAVVVVGTYLLFLHGSLFVLSRLRGPGSGYLSGTRMLVVSQLVFRMRDNARLLATIATLSAVVLSAAGTFYILTRQVALDTEARFVQPLALLEPAPDTGGSGAPGGYLTAATVDEILAAHGVTPTLRAELPIVEGELSVGERSVPVVYAPRDAFIELVERTGGRPELGEVRTVPVAPGGAGTLVAQAVTAPVSQIPMLWGTWYLVDDAEFATVAASSPAGAPGRLYLFDWPGATRGTGMGGGAGGAAAAAVSAAVPRQYDHLVADRYGAETETKQVLGLSMFVGVFVSLLFFIGAGSLIYFKLFTELPDDRRLFTRLRRIGITRAETDRVVTAQVALVFMLPFAVGGVHAMVALNSLGNLLMVNVVGYSLLVVALFGVVQLAFLALTRWTYLRALLPGR